MFLKSISHIRTNNFTDPEMQQKIGAQWMSHQIQSDAEFKAGHSAYGVYHDYESNYQGDYTFSLCVECPGADAEFNTSDFTYVTYPVGTPIHNHIGPAWNTVWSDEAEGRLQRAYTVDFEEWKPDHTCVINIAV